jgi:hypothetical protein
MAREGFLMRIRLGRVYRRKGRALRAKIRIVRGLQGQVKLGRARKRPKRARKSNTAPLAIEKSLLRTLASSLYVIYTGNGIRKQTGSGKQSKREPFPLTQRLQTSN